MLRHVFRDDILRRHLLFVQCRNEQKLGVMMLPGTSKSRVFAAAMFVLLAVTGVVSRMPPC
jgi:hypothetical protein